MNIIQRICQYFGGRKQNNHENEPEELGTLHPAATEEKMEEVHETLDQYEESLKQDVPDHPAFGGEPTGQDPDGTVDVASDTAETTTPNHPVFEQ